MGDVIAGLQVEANDCLIQQFELAANDAIYLAKALGYKRMEMMQNVG
jgi:hypothetical protein